MDRHRPKWRNKLGSRPQGSSPAGPHRAARDPLDAYYRSLGPGQPGYRNHPGCSGLDPLDTWAECGRVTGLLIRRILTVIARIATPRHRQGGAPDR